MSTQQGLPCGWLVVNLVMISPNDGANASAPSITPPTGHDRSSSPILPEELHEFLAAGLQRVGQGLLLLGRGDQGGALGRVGRFEPALTDLAAKLRSRVPQVTDVGLHVPELRAERELPIFARHAIPSLPDQ